MQQAQAERMSKHDSVASHTATVSNEAHQEEERAFEQALDRQPSLFHQDSLIASSYIPRATRSHQHINPAWITSSIFQQE